MPHGVRSTRAEPPEAELCSRALQGDDAAWSHLVARHQHRVVVSLVALGLRPHQAQDIAQETWSRLFQQQRRGALDSLDLPGLAIRQARFLALDARRRQRPTVPLDALPLASGAPGPDQRALDRDRLRRVLDALEACGGRDRALFLAAYGAEPVPHSTLAETFGLSVQRTRQILCEVRARLRTALGSS